MALFELFVVMAGFRLCLSMAAPVGPVPHVSGRGPSDEDEFAAQAADFGAGQRDRCVCSPSSVPSLRLRGLGWPPGTRRRAWPYLDKLRPLLARGKPVVVTEHGMRTCRGTDVTATWAPTSPAR
ncbi:hypothetical protein GCM10010170_099880 [Dactylosporangium salmoneum]|uniref:Uncharacterized protein n=1 Tax=Dactylosporangium salmoneum TaxID=53361 RepID=A0ABP5UW88_9ACTN